MYQTITLPNGLRIVHRATDTPVSYCGFMIDCGSRDETEPSQYGLAHFIEHIIFKGTTHRDTWHINNRMESVGGELNAFTTKEDTTFYSIFLHEDFDRACELLCDLVCHPTAPQQELDKECEVVIDEINTYLDSPAESIYDEFENKLFDGQLLGHNILGTEDTVRSFTSQTCLDFIEQHYGPDKTIFFSTGRTPWEHVVKTVSKYYDRTNASLYQRSALSDFVKPSAPQTWTLHQDTHQTHVLLGSRTFPIGHKNAYALALLNNILGGPGMNSRLNIELREKRGLVYSVESLLTHFTDTGYYSIYFGADPKDAQRCIDLCLSQLHRLAQHPLTPRQLDAAKKQFKGQLGVATANLENSAISLARGMLRLGHVSSLEESCAFVDAVTPDQLNEVVVDIFNPEVINIVSITK